MVGSVFPWLALGATGTSVDQLYNVADITADPDEIDPDRVGADARIAHEILVAVSATVGLLLVLIAPLAVSLGLSGTILAVMCCLVVMLRTRQYRTGAEVLVGLVSGIARAAVRRVAAMLWLHPDWRPTVAVVLAATGAVLLAVTLLPATPSVRRGRLGDIAESVALLALLPLLVVATVSFGDPRRSTMATKKDLVEAYSFSRRRLVTAFVSGAPGGREVEPARPGRTIVGGLALAVLAGRRGRDRRRLLPDGARATGRSRA